MKAFKSCFKAAIKTVFPTLVAKEIKMNGKKYKVIQLLGEGGYSFVFLVKNSITGREYALKKLLCQSSEQLELARNEIEIMQKFKHPALLELITSDSVTGTSTSGSNVVHLLFKAYKYGTVVDLVEKSESVHAIVVLRIFLQVCEGLSCMHEGNTPYAHRDIKPHNILLEPIKDAEKFDTYDKFKAIVMDFGSARPAHIKVNSRNQALKVQEEAEAHSTATYRPPELFDTPSECTIDERTDIWSLGCTLYYMIYGESPFEYVLSQAGGSLALAVLSGKITWPSKEAPWDKLVDLAKACLNSEMDQRPNIKQVLEMTHNCLNEMIQDASGDSESRKSL